MQRLNLTSGVLLIDLDLAGKHTGRCEQNVGCVGVTVRELGHSPVKRDCVLYELNGASHHSNDARWRCRFVKSMVG